MRVLLSAYACEPGLGSEPAVGWNWAMGLARRGVETWVITRFSNKQTIEAHLASLPEALQDLHFLYYDLPGWLKRFKKGRHGVHWYYFLWQLGIVPVAAKLLTEQAVDAVHHVTFVNVREHHFLAFLAARNKLPFILGPVSGGESAPQALRKSFPEHGKRHDQIRDWMNLIVRFDPVMNLVFQLSHQIYVTSEQTKALLPKRVQTKTQVALAVGTTDELDKIAPRQPRDTTHALKILYVGNLLYLKGIHFALRGLAKLKHESNRRILLSIIGHGPDEAWLRQMAKELEIEDQVHWPGAMPRDQVLKAYSQHDVFLFPSLHDSGGMVVLEALSAGLPVICLDLGGPGQMVDITCGRVIPTDGCSEDDVVRGLSESLSELASNPEYLATLAEGAHARASELSFEHLIDRIYPQTVKKPENTACQPAR